MTVKKSALLLFLTLSLALLAACGGQAGTTLSPEKDSPAPIPEGAVARCRIVDGAGDGALLLAEEGGSLMRLGTKNADFAVRVDGEEASTADLRDGMLVDIHFSGMVQETYPGGYYQVTALEGYTGELDDRCGLYLRVLEDLWEVDPGLNTGITQLGVDLSGVTDLSGAEKAAVAWRFGELHGIVPLEGTWEELADGGYIDREKLCWEKGCLFTLSGSADGGFEAQKWAGGTGAYFFFDCTAEHESDGTWSYKVGAEAIS